MDLALLSFRRPLLVLRTAWLVLALAVFVLVSGLGPAPAHADQADQHYKRALKYYESKDYPHAIKEFQAAYRVRQLPRILLNIGQVYRKLGMASTALKFYEHYLRVEPNPKAEIKAEVDRYIAQTHAMLDPPEFVSPPAANMSPAEAAAAAVAAAPSNVTSVTVPELYSDDDLQSLSTVPQRGRMVRPGQPGQPGVGPGEQPGMVVGQPMGNPRLPLVPVPGQPGQPGQQPGEPGQPGGGKPPIYKQPWFWGIIGGVAGAAIIVGAAVGAQRANALPADILHPTK